jgi:hypothetical protein
MPKLFTAEGAENAENSYEFNTPPKIKNLFHYIAFIWGSYIRTGAFGPSILNARLFKGMMEDT